MIVMQNRREGFALAGAVLAMVLVGAIVTGGFYAAHQESQVTRSSELADLAQYIAEQGLATVVSTTSANQLNALATNGGPDTVASAVAVQYGGRTVGNYTVTINRLSQWLFSVSSTGTVTIGQAGNNSNSSRTVTNVVRIRNVDFDNQSAMQVFGDLTVTGTSDVVSTDTNLGAWTGCTTQSTTSAVIAQPGANIQQQGAGNIQGTITRQTMGASDFTVFGDLSWNDLVSMATNVYTGNTSLSSINPSVTGGVCQTNVLNNWGAPTTNTNACHNHFPIIYSNGNLHISSNSAGQGILLVNGDLSIQSQFEFYGPIIVMGSIDFRGGSEIMGSVYAYGGGQVGDQSQTAGNMIVQYSSCAVSRAVNGASGVVRSVPIRNRSWMDMTAIQNSF